MRRPILLASLALLTLPATAGASVTIGSTTPTGSELAAQPNRSVTVVQTAAPSGPSYTVPPGTWIVRSVSARLRTLEFGVAAVRFARPVGPNQFTFLGHESIPLTDNSPAAVFTGSSHRAVKGGDVLGVTVNTQASIQADNATGFTYAQDDADVIDGEPDTMTPNAAGDDGAFAISAVLEPDADDDGYADETEDACLGDAEAHVAPCATDVKLDFTVDKTTVAAGGDVNTLATVTNLGPQKAFNVRLYIPFGQNFFYKEIPAGCEQNGPTTFCALGDMAVGQTIKVAQLIGARKYESATTEGVGGYIKSDNRDLNPANDFPPQNAVTIVPVGKDGRLPDADTKDLCVPPSLKGKTLAAAKTALVGAKCRLGKVTKPKAKLKKGYQLVVSTQSVKAGAPVQVQSKVDLKLKAARKPKAKR